MDEEPEEFAKLLESHYESDEPWPMVFLARDTKGTIRLLHSIAQVPMKPSPNAPASTWYNKWVAFANTSTLLRPCPCVLKNDFLGPHSYITQDADAANALAPGDFGKAIQGTNTEDLSTTPAICPLLPQWAEKFLALDALPVAEVLVTLRLICSELEDQDESIDKTTHLEIKNYAYSLLYKAGSGRGQAVSVALSPSFPDETFDSWALTHLAKTFPNRTTQPMGRHPTRPIPSGWQPLPRPVAPAQQSPRPVAPAQQPPRPRPWTPISLQPLKRWQRNWPQRPSQRRTRPNPTSGPPTLEPATKSGHAAQSTPSTPSSRAWPKHPNMRSAPMRETSSRNSHYRKTPSSGSPQAKNSSTASSAEATRLPYPPPHRNGTEDSPPWPSSRGRSKTLPNSGSNAT
jgi:hypothetical protein